MAKIYPDTNRFVDFYRLALDSIDIFDELQKYKGSLVLTEQTIAEFRRNRVSTLKWLVTQFKKTIDVGSPYTTTVLRALPGHKELINSLLAYKKKGEEVLEHLKQLIADEKKDPVAQKFLALAGDATVTKLKLTNQVIESAHRRKLLGNPPCSPDKYSVGDEVIWELLIENMKEDLIIVTRDHTFHENLSLLSEEYHQRTGRKLLLVTEKFSEALETIGQAPTKELIEAEKKVLEPLPASVLGVGEDPASGMTWLPLNYGAQRAAQIIHQIYQQASQEEEAALFGIHHAQEHRRRAAASILQVPPSPSLSSSGPAPSQGPSDGTRPGG